MTMTVHVGKATLLVATAGGAGYWLAAQGAVAAAATPSLDSVVTALIAGAGAAAAIGVALTTLIALGESAAGRREPRAAAALPAPLRRFIMGSVVTAVVIGIAVPANAADGNPGWVPSASASPSASAGPTLAPLAPATSPSPAAPPSNASVAPPTTGVVSEQTPASTPTGTEAHHAAQGAATPPAPVKPPSAHGDARSGGSGGEPSHAVPEGSVTGSSAGSAAVGGAGSATEGSDDSGGVTRHVVTRGDSLWRIAAATLGPNATDAQIAKAWPKIYYANRATIGDNPGLIIPGQRLTIPELVA